MLIPTCDVWAFLATVTIWYGEPKQGDSWFNYHAHQRIDFIHFICEMDDKTMFYYIYFFKCCIIWKCLNNSSFLLQVMVLDAIQDQLIFLLKFTCKLRIVRKVCNSSWITKLKSSWQFRFQQICFLSYYFFKNLLSCFFFSGNI
jgi:hypothetical protein